MGVGATTEVMHQGKQETWPLTVERKLVFLITTKRDNFYKRSTSFDFFRREKAIQQTRIPQVVASGKGTIIPPLETKNHRERGMSEKACEKRAFGGRKISDSEAGLRTRNGQHVE